MILIHMMHHTWNFRFHPLEQPWIACLWTTWEPIQYLASEEPFSVLDRQKNHQVDLDPHWVESPYTHSMKTKIGGIESPMLGASYASKISHGNHPCGPEHTRRSKTQNRQKRPKMAIFGGFKALAKSGVEVLQNKNFSCKVQSI